MRKPKHLDKTCNLLLSKEMLSLPGHLLTEQPSLQTAWENTEVEYLSEKERRSVSRLTDSGMLMGWSPPDPANLYQGRNMLLGSSVRMVL